MKILYISYWGINEGITNATVIPHLNLLANNSFIDKVYFASIERKPAIAAIKNVPKGIIHFPLFGNSSNFRKPYDFVRFNKSLTELIASKGIKMILCRGVMAGILGCKLNKRLGVQFCVESFEPHAEYMRESFVWRPWGVRYLVQRYWERQQLMRAKYIFPVTDSYRKFLIGNGIDPDRLATMPCAVDVNKFGFSAQDRLEIRGIINCRESTVVGIYVGKFGGIYYEREAFEIFKRAFDFFENKFFLIILSENDSDVILSQMESQGIPNDKILVKKVSHRDVPKYLSAADFAFSTIRPAPSRKFCSPIKHGEYWANGLPIVLTEGVGDDSQIAITEGVGAVFDFNIKASITRAFRDINKMLNEYSRLERQKKIVPIAIKHRNFQIVNILYKKLFSKD